MRVESWLLPAISGLIVACACGGSTEGGADNEDTGSPTGGSPLGGALSGGSASSAGGSDAPTGGNTGGRSPVMAEAGTSGESGAAGAPPEPRRDCPDDLSGIDWNGPFALEFSEVSLSRRRWSDEGPRCTVLTVDTADVDGERSAHLELECTEEGTDPDRPEPTSFELSIDFGPIPGFTLHPLELGSVVRLEHDYEVNINQPGESFLLTTTDETPGFDAGEPILGAVFSYEFRAFQLGPIAVALGPELCVDEQVSFECERASLHDLIVTLPDGPTAASLGNTLRLDTNPPLDFRVTGNRTVTATDGCCFDCADDSISFALWAPE
jgi:hypothetical protein